MSNCKFIRLEAWARKAPHKKNSRDRKASMSGILAELVRAPNAIPHIENPKPPEIVYGGDPVQVWEQAYALAEQAVDAAGARLKSTALLIVVGVASFPTPRRAVESDPQEQIRVARWREKTVDWLRQEFGSHLKLVLAHHDEPYEHVHFALLPTLGADRRIRIGDTHPGFRAEQQRRDAGASRREQKQAHKEAMTQLQDSYYSNVAIEFGFARFGQKRQRLSRDEWKAQTKQLRALAAERDKLSRDRQHVAAAVARLLVERTAEIQREAAAQVIAAKAAAAQEFELLKHRAFTRIRQLTIENGALDAALEQRNALLHEHAEQIEALEAMLAEQDRPKPGR